jgi:transposase
MNLPQFLKTIEQQYGKARRIWIMDRGIPTEETLTQMRASETPVHYLVGTPKGRLSQLERSFLGQDWHKAKDNVQVKLHPVGDELYVLALSDERVHKERGMRRRKLKKLWKRLHELKRMKQTREELLMRLGAARKDAGRTWSLVDIETKGEFTFRLNTTKLRETRRREGRYLLRTNLTASDPAQLWRLYIQLTEIEQAFKEMKHDLGLRPIHHQTDERIQAHIFVAFLSYCLLVTLKARLRRQAGGLTPRSVLEQLKAIQMLDIKAPTTDGRCLTLTRYTQPDAAQQLILARLGLTLPPQPPPKIASPGSETAAFVVKT